MEVVKYFFVIIHTNELDFSFFSISNISITVKLIDKFIDELNRQGYDVYDFQISNYLSYESNDLPSLVINELNVNEITDTLIKNSISLFSLYN